MRAHPLTGTHYQSLNPTRVPGICAREDRRLTGLSWFARAGATEQRCSPTDAGMNRSPTKEARRRIWLFVRLFLAPPMPRACVCRWPPAAPSPVPMKAGGSGMNQKSFYQPLAFTKKAPTASVYGLICNSGMPCAYDADGWDYLLARATTATVAYPARADASQSTLCPKAGQIQDVPWHCGQAYAIG